jgi:GxxExxY protein
MTENEIGTIIVGVSIALHRELGSGLLESVYEIILVHELQQQGLNVQRQVSIPIEYHGIRFRIDVSILCRGSQG